MMEFSSLCAHHQLTPSLATADTQRLNHFPETQGITNKGNLLRNLRKMKAIHGLIYSYFPDGFMLPSEYTKFVKAYEASKESAGASASAAADAASAEDDGRVPSRRAVQGGGEGHHSSIWICKPVDGARGNKIFLIRDLGELIYDQPYVVQRCALRPVLVDCELFVRRRPSRLVGAHCRPFASATSSGQCSWEATKWTCACAWVRS